MLTRFQRYLGGSALGLILWSLFFGIGHLPQGIDNAFKAGFLGLLFGILYLWSRGLLAPVLSHALYNVLTIFIFWIVLNG